MLKISFIGPQRKIISFEIDGKSMRYFDDFWKKGIEIYPYPKSLVKKLLRANTGQLKAMGLLIYEANTGKNLEEYNSCKTEEELIEMVRKDCKLKGLIEIK